MKEKMLVVAIMVNVNDNWYGKNYRYYYAGPEGTGFKNKTEARKSAGALKKYVKNRIKQQFGSKGSMSNDVVIGDLNEMETYKYYGAGPSWACDNCEVTVGTIKNIMMAK
jgi:hypothetical protein